MQQDSPKTTAKREEGRRKKEEGRENLPFPLSPVLFFFSLSPSFLVTSASRQYRFSLEFSPCRVAAGAGLQIFGLTREDVDQAAPTCEHTTNSTFLPCLIHSPIALYLTTRLKFLNSNHLGLRSFNPDISGLCVLVKSYNLAVTYLFTNVKWLCRKSQELLQRKRRWVFVLENRYEFPN